MTAVGAPGSDDPLVTEIYLVDPDTPGIETAGPFDGMGMRGNGSSPVAFRRVHVEVDRRLGAAQGGRQESACARGVSQAVDQAAER